VETSALGIATEIFPHSHGNFAVERERNLQPAGAALFVETGGRSSVGRFGVLMANAPQNRPTLI